MYISSIKHNNKYPSNGHLSTQSAVSSFDKFQVMLHLHPFDLLTFSKPRLQDDKHLLKYVQITGYNLVIINISINKVTTVKIKKRRKIESWIQMNTKHVIVSKRFLNKIDETKEHMQIEYKGNNFKKSYLTGVSYQPSWTLLSKINNTWDENNVTIEDVNIDKPSVVLT